MGEIHVENVGTSGDQPPDADFHTTHVYMNHLSIPFVLFVN